MIPDEKALVERLKDKPFALLGVNSDAPREQVPEKLRQAGITWRNALEGGTDGPLARRFNVFAWPTVFVLDAAGVIRHRELRGKDLDAAVDRLVAELQEKR